MPMTRDPVDVVREAVAAINARTLRERALELIEPGFVRHDLVEVFPDSHGPEGAGDFVSMIVAAMPDFHLRIDAIFGQGDRVAVLMTMTGTHTGEALLGRPPTGNALSAHAVFIYRVANGRLAEAWQMVDGLAFHRLAGLHHD